MTNLIDGPHHFAVDGIIHQVLHEAAINLQEIDGEVLQVTEGRQASAEVVQRELAAKTMQRLNEPTGLREIGDSGGLGNLEANLRGIQATGAELLDDERQELVIAHALAGKIDGAHGKTRAFIRRRNQPAKGILHHPAIDGRHEVIAFRRSNEMIRRHQLTLLVAHADEQFEITAHFWSLQRHDGLPVQLEAPFLKRGVDTRRPLHLATASHQIKIVFLEAMDPVATGFLRRIAGAIGSRQRCGYIGRLGVEGDQADARSEAEGTLTPNEPEAADCFAQAISEAQGLIHCAVFQQDRKFITTQPSQSIAPTDFAFQQRAQLTQQRIARVVAAGIVHDAELVQIQMEQCITALTRMGRLQGTFQALLELASVRQAGQHVMTGVVGQASLQFTRFGHVVEDEHTAYHLARTTAPWCCRALHIEFIAVATYQQSRPQSLYRLLLAHGRQQGIFQCLASFLVEGTEHLADVTTERLGQVPTSERFSNGVQVFHLPVPVGGNDTITHTVQRHLRIFFFTEQRFFIALTLGDIEFDSDQTPQSTPSIQLRTEAALYPTPVAVLMTQSMQTAHRPRLSGNVVTNLL